jgi:hypothetical protein
MFRRFALIALALAHPAFAQTIEGDVYLMLQSGQTSKISAAVVALVAADSAAADRLRVCHASEPDSFRILTESARGYPDQKTRDAIARWSNIFWTRNELVAGSLRGRVLRSGRTGMEAHYRIDSVAPGSYALWAEAEVAGRRYAWLVPVTVAAGQRASVDLDNSNVINGAMYCWR